MKRWKTMFVSILTTGILSTIMFAPAGLLPPTEASGLKVVSSLSQLITVGETTQLNAFLSEDPDVKVEARFFSDNTAIAGGLTPNHPFLTAVAPGKVTVTAQYSDPVSKNYYTGTLTINVLPAPAQSKGRIFFIPAAGSCEQGETVSFTARYIDPLTGANTDITSRAAWTSSDSKMASLTKPGQFAAKLPGEIVLSATHLGVSASTTLTVNSPPNGPFIRVVPENVHAGIGDTVQFRVMYYPDWAANPDDVTKESNWVIGKPLAITDGKGSYTAATVGETFITAAYTNQRRTILWDRVPYQVSYVAPLPEATEPTRPEFSTFTVNSRDYHIDYKAFQAPVASYLLEGRAYLPQRALAEAMGVDVVWNSAAQSATFTDPTTGSTVVMRKGSSSYTLNGIKLQMDALPRIVDESLTCPARFLADAFGYRINFNRPNNLVIIYR